MPINIYMPWLSETADTANLARWLKKEGDKVSAGEVIAEIETDKATMEVPSPSEGIVAFIVVPEGTSAVPDRLIAVLATHEEIIAHPDKLFRVSAKQPNPRDRLRRVVSAMPWDQQQMRIFDAAILSGGESEILELNDVADAFFAKVKELADWKQRVSPYDIDLDRNPANFQPLTPLMFLERAAAVYPQHSAIIHGPLRRTYAEFYARTRKLASALAKHGIGRGDTVSVMLANTPAMLEAHYGVPMTQGVLNTLNTRLDARTIAFSFDHAETKVLIIDREFSKMAKEALSLAKVKPLVIDYDDPEYPASGDRLGQIEYEAFVAQGDENFAWKMPDDEWDAIALNYTSGTTGDPKGVVYHHRGAQLLALGNVVTCGMGKHPVYLWTLPMFHCNGWCFPWSISVVAGTHVCLRAVRAAAMYDAIANYKVTHLCGAPIVMATLLNAPENEKKALPHVVEFFTAAAPPPAAVLAAMKEAGFNVTHLYGLTECYGPAVVNDWHSEWNALPLGEQAEKKSRQGVRYGALEALDVMVPETMKPVPRDGETMGEVMMRGNVVMRGYLKNKKSTDAAFAGGWFHTGDLGVMHPDGYIQLKDRSKDIIISGGENISSIEVEDALYKHPAVQAAAVVAKPDDKWGETPCAFVELKPGASVTAEEIIAHCKENLAGYKVPRHVVFGEVPKTSTGKIQKFKLREVAKGA